MSELNPEFNPKDLVRKATREHGSNEQYERIVKEAQLRCDQQLTECGVTTGFRYDEASRERAAQKYRDLVYKAFEGALPVGRIEAFIEYKRIAHLTIVTQAVKTRVDAEYTHDREEVAEGKKRLMAEVSVFYEMSPDDPWMKFLDAYLDGEPLDFVSPDDLRYLAEAQDRLDNL